MTDFPLNHPDNLATITDKISSLESRITQAEQAIKLQDSLFRLKQDEPKNII